MISLKKLRSGGRQPKKNVTSILERRICTIEKQLEVISQWICSEFGYVLQQNKASNLGVSQTKFSGSTSQSVVDPVLKRHLDLEVSPSNSNMRSVETLEDLTNHQTDDMKDSGSLFSSLNLNTFGIDRPVRQRKQTFKILNFDHDSDSDTHTCKSQNTSMEETDPLFISPDEKYNVQSPSSHDFVPNKVAGSFVLLDSEQIKTEPPATDDSISESDVEHLNNARESKPKPKDKSNTTSKLPRPQQILTKKSIVIQSCSDFNEEFKSLENLQRHLETKHSNQKSIRIHKCETEGCKKTFRRRHTLLNHQSIHTGIKRVDLCGVCGKSISKGNLTVHMRSHSDEKKYKCDICGKSFRHTQTLHQHKDMHLGVKDQCKICGIQILHNHLKRHIKHIHEMIRPYLCPQCPNAFKRRDHLYRHLKTHENPNSKKRGLNKYRENFVRKNKPKVIPNLEYEDVD